MLSATSKVLPFTLARWLRNILSNCTICVYINGKGDSLAPQRTPTMVCSVPTIYLRLVIHFAVEVKGGFLH